MDGNFKAEHMKPKNPDEELWLMDGSGYMVTSGMYKQYLANSSNPIEVCQCFTVSSNAVLTEWQAV